MQKENQVFRTRLLSILRKKKKNHVQKITLKKITETISNKCFYNVYRDTGKDFDIDSVLKVIQTS